MALIPFKVSARTALLLGRENVATQKGAIIELVKNAYDADSPLCIVYFDNKYSDIKPEISIDYVNDLVEKGIDIDRIQEIYSLQEDRYVQKEHIDRNVLNRFIQYCSKLNGLYLIDLGEGMTKSIIENYWMMIGTNNKLTKAFTNNQRVKAGAKGIGRFALDRLGSRCEMKTFYNPDSHELSDKEKIIVGYEWKVNWQDFEGETKSIGDVGADLNEISSDTLTSQLKNISSDIDWASYMPQVSQNYGTILKISNLRDLWDDEAVQELFSDLEVLVPPKDSDDFKIIVLTSSKPQGYGEVVSSLCDDYDYKIVAKADQDQNIRITIYRQEYDVEAIPQSFFERPALLADPKYHRSTFLQGYWKDQYTFSNLLPRNNTEIDSSSFFNDIGPFEFNFYFLKRGANKDDTERFFYRKFPAHLRRAWLSKFGGIKLFRDNFRVRPYGEAKDVAFDWLGLGNRKVASPAGIAKIEGGYRVEPENVAGSIKISRLANLNFEDKSSREGLQENSTFQLFKTLIASIIHLFEEDRSFIARELDAYYDERFGFQNDINAAEKLAKSILERAREKAEEDPQEEDQDNPPLDDEVLALAHLNESKNTVIEKLVEEQKLLRALASSGIVSASFGHDFSKISDSLGYRVDFIKSLLAPKVSADDFNDVQDRKNPFCELDKMKKQDSKIRNWLNISLGFTRKDKRSRSKLNLQNYFQSFSNDWDLALTQRGIEFNASCEDSLEMRVFEIDFDSIFSNLIVNSIEAFKNSKEEFPRQINITCVKGPAEIAIEYKDTGPGLSKDLRDPEIIFEPLFTTTRNSRTGEETGTGLGMWIIKSIVLENSGKLNLIFPTRGFGLRMAFPVKYES